MRILFVTPYVPSSVRSRPFNLIRELSRQGHQVTLACLVQPAAELKYLDEVRPFCQAVYPVVVKRSEALRNALLSLPTPTPLSVAFCQSKELAQTVQALVEQGEFDLIHTEFVRAAPLTARITGLPRVFDTVDSLTLAHRRSLTAPMVPLVKRLISLVEWIKLRGYEPRMAKKFDRILVSSGVDRQHLSGSHADIDLLPNGVDTEFFAYDPRPREPASIVFLGKMSYYVNVASVLWFYHKIFPLVKQRVPNVRFKIVGRDPVPSIQALASDPAVEVTGTVADVRPHIASAAVAICPMVSGSGTQFKMLEAMAVGTPVLATSISIQGLQTQPGRDVLVADQPEQFADALAALFNDPALQHKLSRNGRAYVEANHQWSVIGQRLELFYQNLSGKHGNQAAYLNSPVTSTYSSHS